MEYVENGCLRNYLKNKIEKQKDQKKKTENKLVKFTLETCEVCLNKK